MNENFNSLPREERPYERCMLHGAGRLSDRELLAVLLRTGSKGRTVLELAGDLLHLVPERQGFTGLRRMTIEELSSVKGIGSVKAVQLKCVLELARRMAREEAGAGIYFKTPASVAEYYMEDLRHREQEVLLLLMLDQKGRLLREKYMFKGTVNASLISPREIFLEALSSRAVQIILVHNHPSGDAKPSKEDKNVTRRIKEAGELVGIRLSDHIIIGEHAYVSFREENYL